MSKLCNMNIKKIVQIRFLPNVPEPFNYQSWILIPIYGWKFRIQD
jgi:hypothetical protein